MTTPPVGAVPIAPYCLDGAPEERVAQVALGLTWYLDEPLVWAQEAASRALALYLAQGPEREYWWFTTSRTTTWTRVLTSGLGQLLESLSSRALDRPRHLFEFSLADETTAPGAGFRYQEIDPARNGRTSYLQMLWPQEHPPTAILRVAQAVAQQWPIWSGIGGHVATWNAHEKAPAFWGIHSWCRRHLGLDVQDPERMAWSAKGGLPGSSWLNVLGAPLIEALKIDVAALASRSWENPIKVADMGRATLVAAGESPTLGDIHWLAYPRAYAEVAQALGKHFVEEPPELLGGFFEPPTTIPWMRRLLDPKGWRGE